MADMRAFRIAYDGEGYHGYQRQPDVRTVEDDIFEALTDLDVWAGETDRPPGYTAAGRTDTGVSALAQTIAVDAPRWLDPTAFNGALPADIRVWAKASVGPGFHATRDATARVYVHYLHAPTASLDRAQAVVDRLSGAHDFHNLTPASTGTERDLRGEVTRDGPFLVLRVTASGFVHELVRRIAALVRRVSTGAADLAFVDRVLAPEPLDGPAGVAPEPGVALVLTDVAYPDRSFTVDASAATAAVDVFRGRAAEASTRVKILESLAGGIGQAAAGGRETRFDNA